MRNAETKQRILHLIIHYLPYIYKQGEKRQYFMMEAVIVHEIYGI